MDGRGSLLIPPPGTPDGTRSPAGMSVPTRNGASTVAMTRVAGSSAEDDLRQVAETLSKTGKVLGAGLAQANDQGQKLRGAISRLERANEWSSAERKRAEDEISSFFNSLHEALRAKEDEILRDTRGVYAVQDEDNKLRLEELVIQGQKLSKACMSIQALHEGSSSATIGSLNSPLNNLLEALESSSRVLEREAETASREEASSEERGVKFRFCNDQSIQRSIESIELAHFENALPPVVLVGTPASTQEEIKRLKLDAQQSSSFIKPADVPASSPGMYNNGSSSFDFAFGGIGGTTPSGESRAGSTRLMSPRAGAGAGAREEQSNEGDSLKIKAVVPYEEDGENKGVVYYMGTKANTQVFANPAMFAHDDPHLVVLYASSQIEGHLASLAGFRHYDGAFFETDTALSSWVSVEVRAGLLAPTHYTLGYFINGQDHVPRNWVLQASRDNISFVTLKVHENDTSLDSEMHLATWRISEQANEQGPFKYFRIMQTGPTSTGTMFLVLSFIEFYGTLFHNPEAQA